MNFLSQIFFTILSSFFNFLNALHPFWWIFNLRFAKRTVKSYTFKVDNSLHLFYARHLPQEGLNFTLPENSINFYHLKLAWPKVSNLLNTDFCEIWNKHLQYKYIQINKTKGLKLHWLCIKSTSILYKHLCTAVVNSAVIEQFASELYQLSLTSIRKLCVS